VTATVQSNGDCSSASSSSLSEVFTDTPLTDLTVEAKSEAPGGTKSTISCVDASNTSVGTGGGSAEDSKLSALGLMPGNLHVHDRRRPVR
jgi:hypothetical protein